MFVFNIVLFVILFLVLLARLILYPKAVIKSCATNPTELAMTGAVLIAYFTIVAQVCNTNEAVTFESQLTSLQIGLTVSQASWGGHAWFVVAYVLWW